MDKEVTEMKILAGSHTASKLCLHQLGSDFRSVGLGEVNKQNPTKQGSQLIPRIQVMGSNPHTRGSTGRQPIPQEALS